MRTAIDRAGRLVIPKALRDSVGITPGQPLDISVRGGRIEIEPAPTPMTLVRQGTGVVAVPDAELPPLTSELVRDTLEQVRR
jgi:AbrB family looped-hinge helix DNA binding protein